MAKSGMEECSHSPDQDAANPLILTGYHSDEDDNTPHLTSHRAVTAEHVKAKLAGATVPDTQVMQALIAEADWRVQYSHDYLSFIAFLAFAALFFAAIGYQVRVGHEYGVNESLLQALPQDPSTGETLQSFASVDDLVTWLNTSLITPIWNDPGCGNGVCNSPAELPGGIYADRGCPDDCGDVRNATVQVTLYGDAGRAFSASRDTFPVQMCWVAPNDAGCLQGVPNPDATIATQESVYFEVDFYLDQGAAAKWTVVVPFQGQTAQISLVLREQIVLLFGGPDPGQSGPQINTWWLRPTSDTRAVVLDGRALAEYLDPAQACSAGFDYTESCSIPFNPSITPPPAGCCVGPRSANVSLPSLNPQKLYQELLKTTPRVIGASDMQANRVVSGLLIRQKRKAFSHKQCGDFQHIYNKTGQFFYHQFADKYGSIDPWCEHYSIDLDGPFGMDPVFLPTSSLYNPALNASDFYAPEEISHVTGLPFAFYNRTAKGFYVLFDVNLSANRAQDWLQYLVDSQFFHRQTSDIKIKVKVYNGIYSIFSLLSVEVRFEFDGSLRITPRVESLSIPYFSIGGWFVQALFFASAIFLFGLDLRKAVTLARQGRLGRAYRSLKRWIRTMSNLIFMIMLGLWIAKEIQVSNLKPKSRYNVYEDLNAPARYTRLVEGDLAPALLMNQEFDRDWDMVVINKAYITLTGINMLLVFLRILDHMHFHPRLGMVTRTLHAAVPNLAAFFVVWTIFVFIYSSMGQLIFGTTVYELSTFSLALNQCIVMSLGDTSINQALLDASTTMWDKIPSRIYFWTYNILAQFIILQFLVAIVVDVFGVIKDEIALQEKQSLDWRVEFRWLVRHWRHLGSVRTLQAIVGTYKEKHMHHKHTQHRGSAGSGSGGKAKPKAVVQDKPSSKYTWRDNVLFVDGVDVPQSQMRAILTRCLEEQYGTVDPDTLNRLLEYVHACFGDTPLDRGLGTGSGNHRASNVGSGKATELSKPQSPVLGPIFQSSSSSVPILSFSTSSQPAQITSITAPTAPSVRSASAAAGGILAFLLLPAMMLSQVAAQPYTYTVQSGTDYPYNDIHPSAGPAAPSACGSIAYGENATSCEARCNAAAACAGYVHYADLNCCYIKSKLVNPTANARTVTHLKTGYPGYIVEYGADYPNNDITATAGPKNIGLCGNSATQESVSACIARCDNTLACVGIAHYADNNCCYLKSVQTGKTSNARTASYKKTVMGCVYPAGNECANIPTPFGPGSSNCVCAEYVGGSTSISTGNSCQANVQCAACMACNTDADCPFRYNCGGGCGGVSYKKPGFNGICLPNCGIAPATNGSHAGC
ncbi:hypothetical protein KFL_006450030 [Klebsormidium nitens]|uniref:Polycystin cation channel PKD1/PKD2 domain-containing protein n=1 Tax=Klebsormidium nitens TaxID=105231 RepID=A0A1Y1IK17_KLENI|nr:hypothetical protein KFL_006450030 [Klebsormidium nitens]|eukprot:GAQ90482.1 hypothetical protein KFL_006450030 [Klebsormidium nitens]